MKNTDDPTLSLPVRLAGKIVADIKAGLWKGDLPGGRSLADHYSVSRNTCVACMKILEKDAVIAAPVVGKKREILIRSDVSNQKKKDPREGVLLVLYTSDQALSTRHPSNLNVVQSLWTEGGGSVISHVVDYDRYSKPQTLLKQLKKRYNATAIVLIAPRLEWLSEAAALLPTYSMGGAWSYDLENVTAHGFDFCHQIDQIITYLYDCGHRRMMIPNYHSQPLAQGFHGAVLAGFDRFKLSHEEAEVVSLEIPNFSSSEPDDWFRFWRESLQKFEPTVVIAVQTIHLQSLYGFCRASKISIPNDLSVFCTEHSIQSEWMWPKPHMQKHSELSVRKNFKQWINGALQSRGMKELSLDIIEGESVRNLDRDD